MPLTTVVLSLCSLQTPSESPFGRFSDIILHICFPMELVFAVLGIICSTIPSNTVLVVLLIGNFQIPMAIIRVVLSCMRLSKLAQDYIHDTENHQKTLVPSLRAFYLLALFQGSLYIGACIFELFSFFLRRSLVRLFEFKGQWGPRAVNLFYQQAYTTCMETGTLAAGNTISGFAIKSLYSNSREMHLSGVCLLDSLLQRRDSSKELISSIARSDKAVSTLISMLGWKGVQDTEIRLFAARVTAEIAGSVRIAGHPCMLKLVSSLLDAEDQPATPKSLLTHGSGNDGGNTDDRPSWLSSSPQACGDNGSRGNDRHEPRRQVSLSKATGVSGNNDVHSQLLRQESSVLPAFGNASNRSTNDQVLHRENCNNNGSWALFQHWSQMKERWSVPDEPPLRYQGCLPILGMVILERLAYDLENCAEIGRATDLITKIIGFISYTSEEASSQSEQQKALTHSSLNFLRRLAITGGKIGATLRQELWESPFLLDNLVGILEDSHISPELWEPSMDIIAKLAWNEDARHEIGRNQVIIGKLMLAFFGGDGFTSMCYDQPLRIAAGEALSVLAIGSADNCLAMLEEQGYELIKDLKDMLRTDEYICVVANLMQNLCAHSLDELRHPGVREHLSAALTLVMGRMLAMEGKQLEALIGLASQICNVIPEQGMVQALSRVEKTPSKVEKYRVFFGNAGVVLESGSPLPVIVARAKWLIDPAAPTPGAQPGDYA
ncbi:hypothetical protein ACP4OV_031657 [Aristida adscensionis]